MEIEYSVEIEKQEDFIKRNKGINEKADEQVLGFIYDFITRQAKDIFGYKLIEKTFLDGYCYYFAHMLKIAFERGTVCWCAPFNHLVWKDENDVPYDIEGVSIAEYEYLIPESFIKEGIDDFKHVPGKKFDATEEYIQQTVERYKRSIV